MDEGTMNKIREYLEQGRAFEVKYGAGGAIVEEAKGISKVALSKDDTKGLRIGKKKAGRKVPKEQKHFLGSVAEMLLSANVPFKVTFGPKEFTLRFDLDHYVHMYPDKCVIVGFKDLNEKPLLCIKNLLGSISNIKLLS